MNVRAPELSQRYLEALRAHLGIQRVRGTAVARSLGRDVIKGGFTTVDLARMHEQSVAALALSHDFANARNGLIRRAGKFLAAALVPVEQFHRATRASFEQLQQRTEILRLHRAALAKGNRRLEREIKHRRAGEAAVKKGRKHYHQLFLQSQLMEKKLRRLARQILSAQAAERRAISRELHDHVVQTLVGTNVELEALGSEGAIDPRTLRSGIAFTQRLVRKSVSAVHRFARELRPAVLDDLGLIPALQTYMESLAERKNLKINLTAFAGVDALDNAKCTVLYRVAQEALTNVARHARAPSVDVSLTALPGAVRLEVHDDGKSFRVLQTLSSRTNKRLGLLGQRVRVEMVGGRLNLESTEGHGTTVRAEIPFASEWTA